MKSLKYINLGCGVHFHEDWVNVDFTVTGRNVIAHNLNFGIPFQNDSFDIVYHSHVLEHFSKRNAEFFIRECYRIMKNDGIMRIVVPDLEQIIIEYQKQLQLAISGEVKSDLNYNWIMIELFDQMVRNHTGGLMAEYMKQEKLENEDYVYQRIGNEAKELRKLFFSNKKSVNPKTINISLKSKIKHILRKSFIKFLYNENLEDYIKVGKFRNSGEIHQWMYDRYSLSLILKQNGFKKIEIKTAYKSDIPEFSKFNLDIINGEIRKPDSLFIEAFK
jgi:predicted SAM-dependent methyltransferase